MGHRSTTLRKGTPPLFEAIVTFSFNSRQRSTSRRIKKFYYLMINIK